MPINSIKPQDDDAYWDKLYAEEDTLPKTYNQAAPEPESGNFVRGLNASVNQAQALGGGLKAAVGSLVGQDDWVASGMQDYVRNMEEAEGYAGDVMSVTDIESVTDASAWMAYTLGTLVPDVVSAVALGGVGGVVAKSVVKKGAQKFAEDKVENAAQELLQAGVEKDAAAYVAEFMGTAIVKDQINKAGVKTAIATSATYGGLQGTGASFARILQETGVEAPLTALGVGIVTGGLEALPFTKAFDAMFPSSMKKDFQEYIAAGITEKGTWATQAIKDAYAIGQISFATEIIQHIVDEEALVWVNNNFSENEAMEYSALLTDERKRNELINVGATSLLMGSTLAAGTVAGKTLTGQYNQQTNFGDQAKPVRTQTANDPDLRLKVISVLDRYKAASESGQTLNGSPIDVQDTGVSNADFLAGETLPDNTGVESTSLVDYDGTQIDIPNDQPPNLSVEQGGITVDSPPAIGRSPEDDIVDGFPLAPAFGATVVADGTRDAGPAHTWDAEISPSDKPLGDQLIQLSAAALTVEAQDPNNTDVVVEAIDQDDINRLFERNNTLKIRQNKDDTEGLDLPTVDEAYGETAPAVTNTVGGIMSDLSAAGVPTSFIDAVTGIYVHQESQIDAPAITGTGSFGISINADLIDGSMTDPAQLSELGWSMTHEVYHAADFSMGLSDKDPQFGITVDNDAAQPSVVMGDIMQELYNNWAGDTELGARFDYPFNDLAADINDLDKENAGINKRYRQEAFAQLGALFHSNPKQLQEQAPLAYTFIKNIRDANLQTALAPEANNANNNSQTEANSSEPSGVSGQVRPSPVTGSVESALPDAVRPDGEEGSGSGRADTAVEGSQQDAPEQRQRSAVQKPDVANDTRGQGKQYHGTSTPINKLSEYTYGSLNIYGQGLYTTDAIDVAGGYSNKGKGAAPSIYSVTPINAPRLYDLDSEITLKDRNIVEKILEDSYPLDESDAGVKLHEKTLGKILDRVRQESEESADNIQADFDSIVGYLSNNGYRGYKHIGGKFTNSTPHNVEIYWFADTDINLENTDPKQLTPELKTVAAEPITRTEVVLKATDKKPTFKKALNWEDTGNHVVTFPDGDRYVLYFDDDASQDRKADDDEVYYTSEDGKLLGADALLGETKAETIELLNDYRKKLMTAGENSYNLPLDPDVGAEIEGNAWSFIDDKGEVTEKQLRTKFKALNDDQFENLTNRLLNQEAAEDTIILEDGKYLSADYVLERDYGGIDDMNFIKKGSEYLLQKSSGPVGEKKTLPVIKITPTTKDPSGEVKRMTDIVAKHPEALSSPEAWLAFERDLTGTNETLAPPYGLIRLYNDIDSWVSLHSNLTPEQLGAADRGLATTKRMKELYASGQATPNATAKLMLWGLLSRRHTASGQEAGFVDLMTGSTAVSDLADKALAGDVSDADVKAWEKQATKLIPEGSFGRTGVSNANDFGRLMQKLAAPYDENITKLQKLHDLMASDLPTKEVRHEFHMLVQGSGIDNKVFSFNMLMIGRDDVVILDRIQLNSMWDSERYGKKIYADIADEFSGLRGLARYEAIETSLQNKVKDFYKKLGRPEDASVGRYHWESWVRDSGQVVAHPTMQGLEKDIKGESSPYAFIGAPEGKMNTYAYSAIYGRDNEGTPYYVYPDSKGTFHRFNLDKWDVFKKEIQKPQNGIVDKSFRVSHFDKGTPWYESDQVNRQKLDELVESYAEREAVEREYASERAVTSSATDGTGLADRRKQVYRSLRSAATPDSGSGRTEGGIPRRFRRRTGKHSQVLVAGQKVSGSKRELETSAKAALQEVESFNGTVIELASNKTNAKLFASKIQAGKDASPFGAAVYMYAESDYQNMKMFMTEDGSAGIAVADGDTIVSLYNTGTHKNVTYSLASLAVEEGGLYSDAFDTQLPYIYQHVGFRVTSRLKWDDTKAPDNWDKGQFKVFNKGEPDVVFMVVDPNYFGPYSKDVGYYVEDYDEGMRSIRETRRPEQERISPKLKQAVQDRIDRNITAAELNDIFRKEGRYVKPMHPDMIAPLKADSHYTNALAITNKEGVDKKTGKQKPRKETYWMADALVDGERYGSRLDIPAYKDPDKYERADIVTMHTPKRNGNNVSAGARLGYYPTVQLRGVLFSSPEKATTKIAIGAEKNTIATIEGNYVAADHEQNRLDFIAAMDDPAWTQVSMNPERHSFYYDLATQTPVVSASEVIQVGNLVIAKDVVYDDVEEFSYIKKKQTNKETNTLDDGSPSTSQFTYNDEIDLQTYNLRRFKATKTYKSLVDKYAPMEDFERQAAEYLEYGRLPAPISPRDQENLMHGKVQEDLKAFNENFVDPIGDMIAKTGVDVEAVGLYLLAKHAPERNEAIAERVKAQREKNIATTEREINRLLDDVGIDHTVALATQKKKLEDYRTLPLPFEGTGSGMTSEQSQSILSFAERDGMAEDMEAIAGKVYEMMDYQRNLMVEYGLLDEASMEDWLVRYKFYVPLKGFYDASDPDKFKKGTGTKGFSIVGSESMKAKGRKTLPANPLLNAFEDVQKKIIRARKNEASQTLLTLLSDLGDSQSYNIYNNKYRPMMESDPLTMQDMKQMSKDTRANGDRKYIEVKRGGQTFFIEFKSDTLNASLQNMAVDGLDKANKTVEAVFSGLTRFQTFRRNMLINYNPSWGLVNPIRDVQTALMFALSESDKLGGRLNGKGVVKEMTKEYFPSMQALYRFYRDKPAREGNELDRYAAEFHEDGAATGLILMKDQGEQLRIIINKLNKSPSREAIKSVGKFVEDFNTTMENAVRLSIYVASRRSGVDRATAATLAKDVTVNFNRKGESTATINALYLFFNAAVQGNVNIAQAMAAQERVTENPDGTKESKKQRFTKARAAATGLVAMGYAFSLINQWNSEEDDDGELKYQDIPEHSKNRVQLIMLNSTEGAAIPLSYGYNFFTNIGRLGAEMQSGVTSTPDAAMALVDNFFLNFVPITHSKGDSVEENLRGYYPDILEVHLDLMANKNFFGSDIYQKQNPLFIPKARSHTGRKSTPDVYKNATEFLNDATGGDMYREGSVMGFNTSFNPDKIKYIFDYLAGGLGRDVVKLGDLVGKVASGNADEITARSIPVVGTFVKETSDYEDRFEWYDNFTFIRQVNARFKTAQEDLDTDELTRLRQDYKHYGQVMGMHKLVEKQMRGYAKQRKIEERFNTNADDRTMKIQSLLDKENKLVDHYNKAFRKATELSKQ